MVTRSSRGIGRAMTLRFTHAGAGVVINDAVNAATGWIDVRGKAVEGT